MYEVTFVTRRTYKKYPYYKKTFDSMESLCRYVMTNCGYRSEKQQYVRQWNLTKKDIINLNTKIVAMEKTKR